MRQHYADPPTGLQDRASFAIVAVPLPGTRPGPDSHGAASATSTPEARHRRGDAQLCAHIFSVSAGLVGVCLTVIGLFRIMLRSQHVDSIADNLLALNALLFLAACALAYFALRTCTDARAARLERAADVAFLSALAMMAATGMLVAYEVI